MAFVGTLNPTGGDVSLFLPLEHKVIAHLAPDTERTAVYARYTFIGSIGGALGALGAGALDWLDMLLPAIVATSCLFAAYGAAGLAAFLLYLPLACGSAASRLCSVSSASPCRSTTSPPRPSFSAAPATRRARCSPGSYPTARSSMPSSAAS